MKLELKQSPSDAFILAAAYRERYYQERSCNPLPHPVTQLYKDRMDFWSELADLEVFDDVEYDILVRPK